MSNERARTAATRRDRQGPRGAAQARRDLGGTGRGTRTIALSVSHPEREREKESILHWLVARTNVYLACVRYFSCTLTIESMCGFPRASPPSTPPRGLSTPALEMYVEGVAGHSQEFLVCDPAKGLAL